MSRAHPAKPATPKDVAWLIGHIAEQRRKAATRGDWAEVDVRDAELREARLVLREAEGR